MSTVAIIDPVNAKAFEIRRFALDVRAIVSTVDDIDQLADMEAALVGARHRLKQLGEEVSEAERTRVLVLQRIGELLGPGEPGRVIATDVNGNATTIPGTPVTAQGERTLRHRARLLATHPDVVADNLTDPRVSLSRVLKAIQVKRTEERAVETAALMEAALRDAPRNLQRGQWWGLGDHRLYVGDSTDPAFTEACRVTNPMFAFADPPSIGDNGFAWAHDYLIDLAPIVAVTPGNPELLPFLRATSMPYVWIVCAWVANGMTRGELGFSNWVPVPLFAREGVSLHRDSQDVLRVTIDPSTSADVSHAHRKPIRLMLKLIELFSSVGETVVDPFLGSGTTLIAADKLERRCIGAEIDPIHCGEIVARYGKGATLLST
jgi:hypothetical protein